MFSKKNKNKTYGIIGIGRFGMALAMELAEAGADIIALDKNEEKIREMREYTENAFVVNNLEKKTLLETGIQNCDIAVVCIGEHLDTSILTTLHLISIGIPKVIAKSKSAEHGEVLEKLGAEVVYPEKDMAVRLAHRLETSKVLDYVQLSEKLNISKQMVPDNMVGKSIMEVNVRKKFGVNIIAVENNGELNESLRPDYEFQKDDILFLSGSRENLNKFADSTH